MYIVSYYERKLTLEMKFRAKNDVAMGHKMKFRPLDTHPLLSAFNYVHLALISVLHDKSIAVLVLFFS